MSCDLIDCVYYTCRQCKNSRWTKEEGQHCIIDHCPCFNCNRKKNTYDKVN